MSKPKVTREVADYDIVLFTDGSSRGNPGRGGWGTVAILPLLDWVDELGGYSPRTTNNEMELTAIAEGLRYVRSKKNQPSVLLLSDSSYAINGATSWVSGWKRRGWKTATGSDVLNLELWMAIEELQKGMDITYQHIRGHQGIPGNERTDAIATAFADSLDAKLYSGAFPKYGVQNILELQPSTQIVSGAKKTSSKTSSKGNQWYISCVDGVVLRHDDWASCKDRVHGVKARFKKVSSQLEESTVLHDWGCKL